MSNKQLTETIEKALEAASRGAFYEPTAVSYLNKHAPEWLRALLEENKRLSGMVDDVTNKWDKSIDRWNDRVQALHSELSAKDKVLEWYAEEDVYDTGFANPDGSREDALISLDQGDKARSILSQYRQGE